MNEPAKSSVELALEPFESSASGFSEAAVADALGRIGDSIPDGPERITWRAEWAAAMFHRAPDKVSVWGTTFGPAAVFTRDDGSNAYSPDIQDVDGETIDYWSRRSQESRHPVLRARYADLCWDLARKAAARNPAPQHARAAIDSYVEASRLEYRFAIQPIGYLTRALDLTLMMRDVTRTGEIVDEMFVLHERVADPTKAGTFPFLFDNLYDHKSILLTPEQLDRIVAGLKEALRVSTQLGANYDPISAEAAASRLAAHFKRIREPREVHRAWRAYGSAVEGAALQAGPMLALGWLHPILQMYRREGLAEDAERVSRFLSDNSQGLEGEFKTISVPFEMPVAKMKAYVDALTDGDLNDALGKIAVRFVARAADAREILDEGAKNAPLQAFFPIQKVRGGHVVATIGSVEGDPEGRLIHQLAQNIAIHTVFLAATVSRLIERHTPTSADIARWVSKSGFFTDRDDLLVCGFSAFLNGDDIAAVHILLPQVENGLRELAAAIAIPPKKLNPRTGVMEDKNLSDILSDEAFHNVAGEDLVLYLRALLNDKRGHNMRNLVLHGLMPASYFTRQMSLRIVHAILLVGVIRVTKREAAE